MAVLQSTAINSAIFEPKVQNRFLMSMETSGIPGFMVKNVTAPNFEDEVVT